MDSRRLSERPAAENTKPNPTEGTQWRLGEEARFGFDRPGTQRGTSVPLEQLERQKVSDNHPPEQARVLTERRRGRSASGLGDGRRGGEQERDSSRRERTCADRETRLRLRLVRGRISEYLGFWGLGEWGAERVSANFWNRRLTWFPAAGVGGGDTCRVALLRINKQNRMIII